jgi:DnaK suppressor protein
VEGYAAIRRRLVAERSAALARLAALTSDFDAIVADAGGTADDEHDPDGTTAYERQHVAALIEATRAGLAGVDDALARLAAGSYGICARCGSQIAPGRLTARPAATTCIACATG